MLGVAALVSSVALLAGGSTEAQTVQVSSSPVLTLSVTGRGWGHGIGMSQWGAYGFAQRGVTYDRILAHYYPGTELSTVAGTPFRVLVAEAAANVTVGSEAPFTLRDAAGATRELEAGRYPLNRQLRIGDETFTPPLQLTPKGAPLSVGPNRYRGSLTVHVEQNRLNVVNTLGLEPYLLGVVPREVPSTWPAEAIKAQAVAARSYALATRKPGGTFDAYADVRSQVYGGIDAESAATTAAVQATAREVLLYQGRVATTYFFSTSGGKTVSVSEAWPGSQQLPYLVSVDDPYDDASPHHTWGPVAITSAQLRSAFKLATAPVDARIRLGASGRASHLVLTLASGSEVSIPSAAVRRELGLRSTWFRIGVLFLRPPQQTPATFNTRVRVTGLARNAGAPALERRSPGGAWERVPVSVARNGTFALPFRAERTTDFRLATPRLKGAVLRVAVAPRVTLTAQGGTFQGVVRPALPGVAVLIQRQEGSRWTNAGTTTAGGDGAFAAELEPAAGVYRARVAKRPGYAAGFSKPLSVAP